MGTNKVSRISLLLVHAMFLALSAQLYAQNSCVISDTLFDISQAFCNSNRMGAEYEQSVDNLTNAIDRIKEKFTSTDNDPCIPDALENLMRDRICNNSQKIVIHCRQGTNKEVIYEDSKWYIICKKKFLFITYKKKIQIVEPPAGNSSYTAIFLPPELLKSSVDKIEQTLFHELIHNAENYYGFKTYNNEAVSSENYTYTCTKQCFPTSTECPRDFSKCKTCNDYVPPSNR